MPYLRQTLRPVLGLATVLFFMNLAAVAQDRMQAANRITEAIDNRNMVVRSGDVHPLARAEYDQGGAPGDMRMERMVLVLQADAAQEQALEELLNAQQDPGSPDYQHWLTPEAFGASFGVSAGDVDQIVAWLQSSGFSVEPVSAARRVVIFSGSVDQVSAAFHTDIHVYNVNGAKHYANQRPQEIPRALAGVVRGVASLNDFHSAPLYAGLRAGPQFGSGLGAAWTNGSSHYLTPGDFGVIYDVASLYASSTDGTGQSIAVLGRTNINLSDVQTFRSTFGLPANNATVVLNGPNPGLVSGDETESALDVQWSGAVAPKAAIKLIASASTSASDGVTLSAQYAVSNNVAPVITLSYGSCELALGTSGNQFWNSLWQQAAAQGITVLVAAGDSGSAGCDDPSSSRAQYGNSVNALCSSPYSTCVGGTEFNDSVNPSQYWSATNSSTYTSALKYIPESVWNSSGSVSGGSELWAGGGGPSAVYQKPSWQSGPGVPADGWRDVPDVALTASTYDGYVIYMNGGLYLIGGTSAATPSFAGVMALAAQRKGARLGNANPALYAFATRQAGGGAAVFHDITVGNNTVPGVTGFSAEAGYDRASGLGTVDAALLINHWNDAGGPTFQLSATPATMTVTAGSSATTSVKLTASGGFSSAVTLSANSLPTGVTAAFSPATLPAGTTSSTLTLNAASTAAPATFSFNISGNGGGVTNTLAVQTTVLQKCTYTISPTVANAASAATGYSAQVTAPAGCSWSAAPSASWITLTSGATGNGNGTVAYQVAANAATSARSGSITVTGTGQATPVTLTVNQAAVAFTLGATSANVAAGASTGSISVTAASSTATWTAVSNAAWVSITSGASGRGNQNVGYSVAANTGTAGRSGTITAASLTYTINQAGGACSYSVSPTSVTVGALAGNYTLQVTTTAGCAWTAVSNSSTLNVTAGASGSGSGVVTYSVAPNTSSARSGTLTVAGKTINIMQSAPAAGAAVFSLSPASANVNAQAATGNIAVTASVSTATWTTVSNASWITVPSATNQGNENVGYLVAANTSTSPRTGTITVAGVAFTITQAGVPCNESVGNPTVVPNSAGFSMAFPVITAAGCTWTATSN
jgi:pseudomonalisin